MDTWPDFQHLSSLTALQQLSVKCREGLDLVGFSGMQQLSLLTKLELSSLDLQFSTNSTSSWTHLTALQCLELSRGHVEPGALSRFTQLRALSLFGVCSAGHPELRDLLGAVSQLSQVTRLSGVKRSQ
jgi:hypothetical protein